MDQYGVGLMFKPIIDENRRRYNGKDCLVDLEYLAGEMLKMKNERDPSYKVSGEVCEIYPRESKHSIILFSLPPECNQ